MYIVGFMLGAIVTTMGIASIPGGFPGKEAEAAVPCYDIALNNQEQVARDDAVSIVARRCSFTWDEVPRERRKS